MLKTFVPKRVLMVAVVALVLAAATVGLVAASGVTILTAPIGTTDLYYDANGDGATDPSEFVGTFPIYDGQQEVVFTWAPYAFPAGANGSYRVSLWQNFGPPTQPDWHENNVSHTWADNPAGTTYAMGPFFTQTELCVDCPSMFVVQPETYRYLSDDFIYAPIAGALTAGSGPAGYSSSDQFVLENLGDPDKTPKPGPVECRDCPK